ncbi:MAG: hypothetical protein HC927_08750 [Deltaproteobacteria bacterium]|nr:hypothetical protein [Deltaproteobacteria bacterium]
MIDLGPSTLGGLPATTASPDANGNFWNNFGPGQFVRLVDTGGAATASSDPAGIGFGATTNLGATFVFPPNGLENPDGGILGPFAIASATSDYIFSDAGSPVVGLELSSLDPALQYRFRFFGSRVFDVTQEAQYLVDGGNGVQSVTLVTSGTNIGSDGASFANDNIIAGIRGVTPRANGTIVIELSAAQGSFGYLNLLEVSVDDGAPDVSFTQQPTSQIADAGGTLAFSAVADAEFGAVNIRWQRDGVDLVDDGRIVGSQGETLTITGASLADVGVYTAVATGGGVDVSSDGAVAAVRQSATEFDLNGDGVLDVVDLLLFLNAF